MKLVPVNLAAFTLWCTDAATVFSNGFVSGLIAGSAVGGASAATSEYTDAQYLSVKAAIGVLVSCVANAIKHVVVWHSNNPIPNPFRAPAADKLNTPPNEPAE